MIKYLFSTITILITGYLFTYKVIGNTNQKNQIKSPFTIEEVIKIAPESINKLFNAIDLENGGLHAVKKALKNSDTVSACEELLLHFRTIKRDWVINSFDPMNEDEFMRVANGLLENRILLKEAEGQVPIDVSGNWDWKYTGPKDDAEFAYSLNTQNYLPALYHAWAKNKNKKYISKFDNVVKDWILQHPLPKEDDSIFLVLKGINNLDYRDIGELEWRTLDTGRRLGATWPQMFFALQNIKGFSPAARLLMLSSFIDQARYLHQYHKSGHNWTTMEMNGLALVGLAFPEFKESEKWANYALETMNEEINRQVYPDGIQTEVSSKTQWVALRRFESLARHFNNANREISSEYMNRIEEMYNYLAYSMRPDGTQPLNNDSDKDNLRERVLIAAEKFNRQDWVYIATNGREGLKPAGLPSIIFPWAGINIMRSDWGKNATWSFFDNGPYGTGHQHRDMLHLSIHAFGKDILVDGGRYTHEDYFSFDPTIWRGYFRSSFSHNVILVDGKGQNPGPLVGEEALKKGEDFISTKQYDFATGTFTNGFEGLEGESTHSRSVLYTKDNQWFVLDQLNTDQPREIEAMWHYVPQSLVQIKDLQAFSTNTEYPNLMIIPIGKISWESRIVKGQEEPYYQGWYSETYGTKEPNPTVIYSTKISKGNTIFGWVMVATEGKTPELTAEMEVVNSTAKIKVYENNDMIKQVTIPINKELSVIKVEE